MIKNLIKLVNLFKQKIRYEDIKLGVKKGLNLPTLPPKIEKFYGNVWVRIFRVIGGICLGLTITKKFDIFPYPLNYLIVILGFIQIFQIIVISCIKSVYSLNKIMFHPEEFEVRK